MNFVNKNLEDAVIKGELDCVIKFLTAGANVNVRLDKDQNTLLHCVFSTDVTKVLLSHGADVNAVNIDGETPLHSVITRRKGLSVINVLLKFGAKVNIRNNFGQTPLHIAITDKEGLAVVKELLKHGANVNASDNKGNSVLFLAVKYYNSLNVIKELLDYDADINIRSSSLNRFCTPLDIAVRDGDLSCAQLLIKVTVLNNYHNELRKVNELRSYIKFTNCQKLSCYLNDCISEIMLMRDDKLNTYSSVYEFIVQRTELIKPLYVKDTVLDMKIFSKYCIYQDLILERISLCLQRADLLDCLRSCPVNNIFHISGKDVLQKQIILNGDCLFKIGEFLPNVDLLNFLVAINKNTNVSFFCLEKYL